ncbi:MAG: hypothetical protein KUG82_10545 [Pseudomonadales bacterium]|nr:hypothetical protein [Pseudomonadales bacterium]
MSLSHCLSLSHCMSSLGRKLSPSSMSSPLLFVALVLAGCGGENAPPITDDNNARLRGFLEEPIAEEHRPIDASQQIVVFVHGYAGVIDLSVSTLGSLIQIGEDIEFSGNWCSDGITPYTPDEDDDGILKWLTDDGYQVWLAHYTSNTEFTDSLEINSACIGRQISDIAQYDVDGKVTLISSSLGGVVSRYYLEGAAEDSEEYPYQNDVDRFFTLGSPHKGMPIGLFVDLGLLDCDANDALCDIGVTDLREFNSSRDRAEDVVYNFIGGNASMDNIKGGALAIASILNPLGDNDGLVFTSSALGREASFSDYEISGIYGRFETDETHAPNIGINAYQSPRIDSEGNLTELSTAYSGCIQPQLAGEFEYCSNQ